MSVSIKLLGKLTVNPRGRRMERTVRPGCVASGRLKATTLATVQLIPSDRRQGTSRECANKRTQLRVFAYYAWATLLDWGGTEERGESDVGS